LRILPASLFLIRSYAFGILLWEVSTSDVPFRGVPPALLPHKVAYEHLRPIFQDGTPEEYVILARACWDPEALRR
jgi:hypothetical protein